MAEFSNTVITYAQNVQKKYGVPASVTLAAYALESGYGTSSLAHSNNNYFGITGSGTAGYSQGSHKWAKYYSMQESFDAFGQLLTKPLYANKTAGATSIESYIRAYTDTYAPPSDGNAGYSDKMINLVKSNNLTQYDSGELKTDGGTGDNVSYTTGQVISGTWNSALMDTVKKIASNALLVISLLLLLVGCLLFIAKSLNVKIPTKLPEVKSNE